MQKTLPTNISWHDIEKSRKKFSKNIDKLNSSSSFISYGKSIILTNFLDSLRMIYEIEPTNSQDRVIRKLMIKTFSDAESQFKGSGPLAVISFLKSLNKEINEEELTKTLREFSFQSRRASEKDLKKFIDELPVEESFKEYGLRILDSAGFSAACDAESTYEHSDYYSIDDSCRFLVTLDSNFISATKIKKFEKSNVKIIVIDGIIENVSEIHHLLTYFSENKESCFLVSRGFSDDVINTLAVNFIRKTLSVIPCGLVSDIHSINSLKDICIYCKSELVSTLKGDTISSIEVKEIPRVEFIKCDSSGLYIKNSQSISEVLILSNNLKKQLELESVDDKIKILEKRIISLTPRRMNVYFSNHSKDTVGIKKDRLKLMISLLNGCCISGMIELKNRPNEILLNSICSYLEESGFNKFPAGPFFHGIYTGIINANMLNRTKKLIAVD